MIGNKSGLEGPPFGISINFIILILSNGTTIERLDYNFLALFFPNSGPLCGNGMTSK